MLDHGDLDMGHARALLALKNKDQVSVAKLVVEKALSVRQAEQYVRDILNPPSARQKPEVATDIEQLTQRLSERLGASVEINHNNKGKGKMVIRYHSLDELDGILSVLESES